MPMILLWIEFHLICAFVVIAWWVFFSVEEPESVRPLSPSSSLSEAPGSVMAESRPGETREEVQMVADTSHF